MAEQVGPKTAIVSSKELGTKCWLTARFIDGVRCPLVITCKYSIMKTCKAVEAELKFLEEDAPQEAHLKYENKLASLQDMSTKLRTERKGER